jgi:hypothetical protein
MSETCSIQVELPDDLAASADNLEVLRTVFQTIITLSRECGNRSNPELQAMLAGDWEVHCGLTWSATAQRGKEFETATGNTKEEALAQLRQMTCLHEMDGCP